MTTLTAPPGTGTTAEEIRRASYIDGLRALADILEEHDRIPLPYHGTGAEITISAFLYADDPRAELAAAARAFPVRWRKDARDSDCGPAYFDLHGDLHGLGLRLTAYRDAVCTRVVTGTEEKEVEEVVTPAVTRTVTQTFDVVEWRCGSVLAPAEDAA